MIYNMGNTYIYIYIHIHIIYTYTHMIYTHTHTCYADGEVWVRRGDAIDGGRAQAHAVPKL